MSRRPLIAGNWKLHHGPAAAAATCRALRDIAPPDVEIVVFPTALSIPAVANALQGSDIAFGVQDVEAAVEGAWTGSNSARMAREVGCRWALIGHSERRQHHGETDARVAVKTRTVLAEGVLAMICVGETLAQREAGQVESVLASQLAGALDGLAEDQLSGITLAYEPVWAIGTGVTASPEQAQAAHATIRAWLKANFPAWVAEQTRILYGGSVKPSNAAELLSCPDIDGALIGGASLQADSLAAIATAARG